VNAAAHRASPGGAAFALYRSAWASPPRQEAIAMRGNDHLARIWVLYEGLLAEAHEVADRVRERLEELRRRFPDDENLSGRLARDPSPPPGECAGGGRGEPAGR
jgi:hypothetical protein